MGSAGQFHCDEMLSIRDIQHYIKVKNRTFASFCLPIILIVAVIIWALLFILLSSNMIPMIIIGVVLTFAEALGILVLFKKQKKKERVRLYQKISSNWGVVIK